ncbi:hypothetical protein [Glutamicibacter sp. Je.9.36]|uniref:hypothetical protein n=1 Tax=Glutamicibacter sp. Je.9.36 TaxID=3142837 RepID=UPI003DA7E1AE
MSTTITLRDMDNRDDAGAPFEFTDTTDQAIKYIDGPLRKDIREGGPLVDRLIALLRANVHGSAIAMARHWGVYLSVDSGTSDSIDVLTLGEDGDYWLVTGTTDAWAAEEAIRAHHSYDTGEELDELIGDEPLSIERRHDLKWAVGGLQVSRDEEDYLLTGIVQGESFSGFLVRS